MYTLEGIYTYAMSFDHTLSWIQNIIFGFVEFLKNCVLTQLVYKNSDISRIVCDRSIKKNPVLSIDEKYPVFQNNNRASIAQEN